MTSSHTLILFFTMIAGTALITQSLTYDSLFAHRDGCHRWHSCPSDPSDTGSYVCGDKGYDDQCPKKSKGKKEDSDKTKSKSKTNKDKNTEKDSNKSTSKSKSTASITEKKVSQPITGDANSTSNVPVTNSVTPPLTTKEGIEIAGPVTEVIDGDTVDISVV